MNNGYTNVMKSVNMTLNSKQRLQRKPGKAKKTSFPKE